MINIQHYNRQRVFSLKETAPVVSEAITHVLFASPFARRLMAEGVSVSVDWTLIGPRSMKQLNKKERDMDQTTDILSFPTRAMKEGETLEPLEAFEYFHDGEENSVFLGDLVIAPAKVKAQAEEYGHSFEQELQFLIIHGMLHLLGYDHETDDDAARMRDMERRLMAGLEEIPSGFVALIGRPNVGKSTLLNELSDRTLAITTAKPQTTRHAIRSVLSTDDYQIALLDTPGLHRPKNALGKTMMKATNVAIAQSDVVALMIDASWKPFVGEMERRVIEQAQRDKKPVVLVINKVDLAKKDNILPLIKAYDELFHLAAYVPLSALKADGIDSLIGELTRLLPVRRRLFPIDDETDQTEKILSAELIRREILEQTNEEVPYGVHVMIERFVEDDEHIVIDALILCSKASHKQILIGRGGEKIKSIGTNARRSIEALTDRHVQLSLFVKVKPNWENRPQDFRELAIEVKDH